MQCSQALNGDDSPCDWATELCIIGGTPGAIGAGCIPSGCDASVITGSCFRNPGYAVDNCGVWTVINPQWGVERDGAGGAAHHLGPSVQ